MMQLCDVVKFEWSIGLHIYILRASRHVPFLLGYYHINLPRRSISKSGEKDEAITWRCG